MVYFLHTVVNRFLCITFKDIRLKRRILGHAKPLGAIVLGLLIFSVQIVKEFAPGY